MLFRRISQHLSRTIGKAYFSTLLKTLSRYSPKKALVFAIPISETNWPQLHYFIVYIKFKIYKKSPWIKYFWLGLIHFVSVSFFTFFYATIRQLTQFFHKSYICCIFKTVKSNWRFFSILRIGYFSDKRAQYFFSEILNIHRP